ncbi:MAG: F0F1 ATP synthase subunit B [Leptolyngbyaceae cyanobacterium SL_5_9]|nr:F0F1 ATP synthase subunit B [Leptolyngbyaceae cyanobacterium SL_5_9]
MGTLLLLAAEAGAIANDFSEAAEEGGFGLNFNILDTNLINLAIILGVLFYFGRGFLGKILSERREKIETAIQDAEKRKKEAASSLADQQQKLAQAQTEATRIRAAAEESAKKAKETILVQTEQDIQRIKAAAAQDLNSQQERIIAELRQRVVALALEQAESRLKSDLNENTQQQLIDRSIAMLGGES